MSVYCYLLLFTLSVLCLHTGCSHSCHSPLKASLKSVLKPKKNSAAYNPDSDLLIRALKGEKVERAPVWLMRQVPTSLSPTLHTSISISSLLISALFCRRDAI